VCRRSLGESRKETRKNGTKNRQNPGSTLFLKITQLLEI
jgi:hypothetical protein